MSLSFVFAPTAAVVTPVPCRFLGLVQLYIFLFTEVDYPPSSSAIKWTRFEQLLLVLPVILTLLLFFFDLVFFIIMFKF